MRSQSRYPSSVMPMFSADDAVVRQVEMSLVAPPSADAESLATAPQFSNLTTLSQVARPMDLLAERGTLIRRPRLDLRQLHAFVAVAEELHFGRAAARIHIAQSPLSRIIRSVEIAAGVALFIRNKRRVELTPAGGVLLEGARELLLLAERLEARVTVIPRRMHDASVD